MIELRTDKTMIMSTSSTTRKTMVPEFVLSLYPNIRVSVLKRLITGTQVIVYCYPTFDSR